MGEEKPSGVTLEYEQISHQPPLFSRKTLETHHGLSSAAETQTQESWPPPGAYRHCYKQQEGSQAFWEGISEVPVPERRKGGKQNKQRNQSSIQLVKG